MNHQEISEICYGLIQEGRHPSTIYKPEWFSTPYNKAVELYQQPGISKEDIAKVLSSAYMADASDAVHRFNGIGEYSNFDWSKALREAYDNLERGKKLEKISKKLKENEEVDILPLYAELGTAISGESFGLTPASEINFTNYKPFKPTGYDPIDKTIGGIPTDGPIIICGPTGIGKSKLVTAIINALLHTYPEETAAVYTLEMNKEHWTWRTKNMFPSIKEVLPRLHVSGSMKDIEELVAEVTAKKVNYVVLDDMDNAVIRNEPNEYEAVYRRVKMVCRFMGIPFFVISNPSKETEIAIKAGVRFIESYDAGWSSAAGKSAALFIGVQTVKSGLDVDSDEFPTSEDEMLDYLIFRKSRDGWMGDYDPTKQIGPGAAIMLHSADWNGKPYGGKWKLWTPDMNKKRMTKKATKK